MTIGKGSLVMFANNERIESKLLGAVVIGRNEGERLASAIRSLLAKLDMIVYVDSGSTDNSLVSATQLGVLTVQLDMSIPFTAARARNAGAFYLLERYPNIEYIHFIDGDCEIQPCWIIKAFDFLDSYPEYAVVCGRRRERFPELSVYNLLCDIEWNTPVGDALACGGDALIRVKAYQQVNGYLDDLIAGEEPEMCFRMRKLGWKIRRLDAEMTMHDAAMTKFSQWWKRSVRAGYAYASSYYLHGKSKEHFKAREVSSIFVWGILLPFQCIALSFFYSSFLITFMLYSFQIIRLTLQYKRELDSSKIAFYYAMSNTIGKFPQAQGILKFVFNTIKNKHGTLIEYK